MITALQYGLALRNQEVFGLRWECFDDDSELVHITQALSANTLDIGKTAGSQRETHCPDLLREDLARWREHLTAAGWRTRGVDFVIPGDLGGARWGKTDRRSGGRYISSNQSKKWGPKYFAAAVQAVAELGSQTEDGRKYADIAGATPYALRRGGISLRLRTEPPTTVADECGTSLVMLDAHYGFHLRDLDRLVLRSFDEEWRLARANLGAELSSLRRPLQLVA